MNPRLHCRAGLYGRICRHCGRVMWGMKALRLHLRKAHGLEPIERRIADHQITPALTPVKPM